MIISILNKFLLIISFCLVLLGFSACMSYRPYTSTQLGSDQILNGSVQKDVLFDKNNFPWFYSGYTDYKPEAEIIQSFKPKTSEICVMVFAGSWCSDTHRELPKFYKMMDELGVPDKNIQLFMVDKEKKCNLMKTDVLQIVNVPTFIFYRNGTEVGRIVETTVKPIEKYLADFYGSK